jgi:ribosomal-protein-alanine N-acetyltransferase
MLQDVNILIRHCRTNDLDRVYDIERTSFPDYWTKVSLEYLLRINSQGFFVAEINEKIIGYAIASIERNLWKPWKTFGHLVNIAVDPEFRGKGIGRELAETVIEYLKSKKIRKVILEVRTSNIVAKNLYASMGFLETGVKEKYYEDGESAIIMAKEIEDKLD